MERPRTRNADHGTTGVPAADDTGGRPNPPGAPVPRRGATTTDRAGSPGGPPAGGASATASAAMDARVPEPRAQAVSARHPRAAAAHAPDPHGEDRPGAQPGPGVVRTQRHEPVARTAHDPEDPADPEGHPDSPPEAARSGASTGPPAGPDRQVRRVSVRGQVLDALRAALAEGELVPGEVYSAPVLGERFGVSATPVREAMQQLACEGAVEVVLNRGFRVLCRSARELAELAEVRALIEVPVVLRLAHGLPAGRWAELRPLAEAAVTAAGCADRAQYVVADRAFHRALLGLAGNQQLVRTVDDLHRRAQWPRVNGTDPCRRAGLGAHAAQHVALLDALTTRDLILVESLVRNHYTTPDD